ncbi:hypothetical protein [Helicobacter sp. T3_23-1059]
MQIKKLIIIAVAICLFMFMAYPLGIYIRFMPNWWIQPNYWVFKSMCKVVALPDSEEKYSKILAYYGLKLGDEKIDFSDRINYRWDIEMYLYLDLVDNTNPSLTIGNIKSMDFRPDWIFYYPTFYGNEGSMKIDFDFKQNMQCEYFSGLPKSTNEPICFKDNQRISCNKMVNNE